MSRDYLAFSVIACLAYSLVAPLLSVAMVEIPSTTAVFISNTILLCVVGVVLLANGHSVRPYLTHPLRFHVVAMGVLLTVGLLSYYRALELGPVSVVVPIYGLFIVVSAAVGVVALGERVNRRKVASVVLSVIAIALMSL